MGQALRFECNINKFNYIPENTLAYWINNNISSVFKNGISIVKKFDVRKGADTGDNNKYLRLWFEISSIDFHSINSNEDKWVSYSKGGDFRRWYGNKDYVVYWKNNGKDLKANKANLRSPHMYFKKTITWSALTSGGSSFRVNDANGLFDSAGSSMMPSDNIYNYILGLMNTKIADCIFDILNPTLNYGAGTVGLFPLIYVNNDSNIDEFVANNIENSKQDWDSFETSWDFKKHPLI